MPIRGEPGAGNGKWGIDPRSPEISGRQQTDQTIEGRAIPIERLHRTDIRQNSILKNRNPDGRTRTPRLPRRRAPRKINPQIPHVMILPLASEARQRHLLRRARPRAVSPEKLPRTLLKDRLNMVSRRDSQSRLKRVGSWGAVANRVKGREGAGVLPGDADIAWLQPHRFTISLFALFETGAKQCCAEGASPSPDLDMPDSQKGVSIMIGRVHFQDLLGHASRPTGNPFPNSGGGTHGATFQRQSDRRLKPSLRVVRLKLHRSLGVDEGALKDLGIGGIPSGDSRRQQRASRERLFIRPRSALRRAGRLQEGSPFKQLSLMPRLSEGVTEARSAQKNHDNRRQTQSTGAWLGGDVV